MGKLLSSTVPAAIAPVAALRQRPADAGRRKPKKKDGRPDGSTVLDVFQPGSLRGPIETGPLRA